MKRILLALLLALSVAPALAAAPPNPPSVSVVGGNASLSVSGVTARVALPVSTTTFPAVTLVNDGTTEVFWQGGDTSVVATTGNYPLQPGRFISVWLGNATNIAAITAGGSSTLRVIQFNGAASMGGAPDGSGAGGTVTLGAGTAIAGKFGIDQTTPGTTNGVQVNAALPAGTSSIGSVGASKHVVGTTLTRIANGTTYSGTTTSPVAICLFTSVTVCAPMTVTVSSNAAVNGFATRVVLEKSTTGASGATFLIYLYQAAPTLTSIFDTTIYNVKAADITSGAWVGTWTCSSEQVNTDNATYECSAQAASGNNAFSVTDSLLRAVLVTTGSYVPGNGETYNVIVDTLQSLP